MFKTKILTRFLITRFLSGVATVMLTICGIIFTITFVERIQHNPTMLSAIMDSWVRLLEYVPLFLPLAIFMGTLFTSYRLTKSTESIIISSGGLSPFQSARPFLIAAALIGVFTTTIVNPYTIGASNKIITADNLKLIDKKIWIRESGTETSITLSAEDVLVKDDSIIFENSILFKQDKQTGKIERIESEYVNLSKDGLSSQNAKIFDSDGLKKTGSWSTNTLLNHKTVLDRYIQPDQISFWELPKFISKMSAVGIPTRAHLIQYWTLLFLPLTLIAMTFLGVAFSQTKQRRNYSFGLKFGSGVIVCFGLYFIINLFNALGATGALPALLAVIAPPLIIIAIAGVSIITMDNI